MFLEVSGMEFALMAGLDLPQVGSYHNALDVFGTAGQPETPLLSIVGQQVHLLSHLQGRLQLLVRGVIYPIEVHRCLAFIQLQIAMALPRYRHTFIMVVDEMQVYSWLRLWFFRIVSA
jgi:hypothetical protein